MGGLLLRLRTWWETADRTQKAVTIFGGVFLVVLLLGTFYFASRPKLVPAFTGLSMTELGSVREEIEKQGVPYTIDEKGTVCLPKDKIALVSSNLATKGKLPQHSNANAISLTSISAFDPQNVESAKLKTILEGQIADTIRQIEGVQSVSVRVNPGTETAFADEKKPATASVQIVEKQGSSLNGEQARAIASLVAFSASGLDTNHVTIVNQAGSIIWDGAGQAEGASGADKKITAEINESKRREREIQATLDQAFGTGATIAKVSVSLDFDVRMTETSTPVASESASEQTKITEKYTGGASGGSNIGAERSTQPPASGKSYDGTQVNTKYQPGIVNETVKKSPGTLKGMSITVLADKNKFENKKALTEFIKGVLPTPADPLEAANFKSTVSLVEFDKTGQTEAKKAAAAGAMSDKIQQGLSLLPILALVFVGFMVVKAIGKAAKDQNVLVQALPDGRMIPIRDGSYGMGGSTDIVAMEDDDDDDPEAAPKKKKRKPEIGEIPDKVDIPLEQVKKMTNERPEAVAMLIKSWLLEDKR